MKDTVFLKEMAPIFKSWRKAQNNTTLTEGGFELNVLQNEILNKDSYLIFPFEKKWKYLRKISPLLFLDPQVKKKVKNKKKEEENP